MNSRAPQAFVRVDIPHAAQYMLIEQQRLDSRAPRTQLRNELRFGRLKRIETELAEDGLAHPVVQNSDAPEPADVRVPELAAVIEREKHMRMRRGGRFG